MLGPELYKWITSPEFRPYTIVLASGEKIEISHRDSVGLHSMETRGRRFFSSSVQVLETDGNEVIERVIALPMVAQIVDRHPMNGANGRH